MEVTELHGEWLGCLVMVVLGIGGRGGVSLFLKAEVGCLALLLSRKAGIILFGKLMVFFFFEQVCPASLLKPTKDMHVASLIKT